MKTSLTIFTICVLFGNVIVKASQSKIIAWGDDGDHQTDIPSNITNVIEISAGGRFGLALQQNGLVIGWGYNLDGETNVPSNATNVIAIAADATTACP